MTVSRETNRTTITRCMSENVALTIFRTIVQDDPCEDDFLSATLGLAEWFGWELVLHIRPGRTMKGWETPIQGTGKGFPDLFGLRESTRQRFTAELKVRTNKKTAEQEKWLHAMEVCGIPAFTWYPADWREIEEVLRNGAQSFEQWQCNICGGFEGTLRRLGA